MGCSARLKTSFELNPVTEGKQGTLPYLTLHYLTLSQQVKYSISLPIEITVNTHCDDTIDRRYCLGNYVTSQWISDIVIHHVDTKQLHD